MKKNYSIRPRRKGFTIVELLVSMGITILIIAMAVTIISVALDTWRESRNEIRASRQAKALLDVLSTDLESMVVRSGNDYEWFNAKAEIPTGDLESSSIAKMVFFTAATDRYNGNIGGPEDMGGDVSTVGYQMEIQNPVTGSKGKFDTYAMYRELVDPDETFGEDKRDLLAQTDLDTKFGTIKTDGTNFICENIYELSIVFLVEYSAEDKDNGGTVMKQMRVPVLASGTGNVVKEFSITGSGLFTIPGKDEIANGRLLSADVSISAISDHGLGVLRAAGGTPPNANFLAENSYRYSTTVRLPQP